MSVTFCEHQVVLYLLLLSLNMIIIMYSSSVYSYGRPAAHSPVKVALPQSSFSCLQPYHTSTFANSVSFCVIKSNGHHSNQVTPFCSRTLELLPFFECLIQFFLFVEAHKSANEHDLAHKGAYTPTSTTKHTLLKLSQM